MGVGRLSTSADFYPDETRSKYNDDHICILIHNINKPILDTVRSRCLSYKLNYNYSDAKFILSDYFNDDLYNNLNLDFKESSLTPKFLVNHINFLNENKLDLVVSKILSIADCTSWL